MRVEFTQEKVTKNTIRFTEVLESELDVSQVGTIYVPKATLKAIGWSDGKKLVMELSTEGN